MVDSTIEQSSTAPHRRTYGNSTPPIRTSSTTPQHHHYQYQVAALGTSQKSRHHRMTRGMSPKRTRRSRLESVRASSELWWISERRQVEEAMVLDGEKTRRAAPI